MPSCLRERINMNSPFSQTGSTSFSIIKAGGTGWQRQLPVFLLYFFLLAGGIWHITGLFQELMEKLALPVMVLTATLLFAIQLVHTAGKYAFLRWTLFVFSLTFFVEWLGVHTGLIFGEYRYGEILNPLISGVPVVIGASWLAILLSSMNLVQKLASRQIKESALQSAILTAVLMVLFDLVMEPAVVKLGYWSWQQDTVPLQNYLSWFALGFLFSYWAFRKKLVYRSSSDFAAHAYFAQMGYFLLIHFM
ncbi:MAG: carotenoid biosynthesis protein [Calditrichia bacterium]